MTTTIAQDSFKEYFDHPSQSIIGALVSTYIAGEAIGACFAAWSGDALGRRHTITIAAATATVGTVIQRLRRENYYWNVGRVRGIMIKRIDAGTDPSWLRIFRAVDASTSNAIPPGLIVLAGIWFLPYSPRWLITQGRESEAYSALKRLMGSDDENFEGMSVEFNRMKEQIKLEKAREVKSISQLWRYYRRRVLVSVAVQTCTSLSGVNVIGYYQTIYMQASASRERLFCYYREHTEHLGVDSWGRTRSLFWGAIALVIDLTLVMVGTQWSNNSVGQGFIIAFIFCYTFIYYLGFNSVTWTYGAEVLPVHIRSKGNALAAFSHFVFNIAVNQAAPTAFATIGYRFYALFIALNLCTAVMVWAYFPETKGLSLEEIADYSGTK
ncbi:Sugar (and other) transporter [Rhizoctonia solani]|uniref:Sugar (And other) transporter n=1 Tax=Rhizoctonia solani TaxID=456999 RepID=A0A8H8NT78_9AGAM|nr:Sugar (and other) transporter [Rhizoctonia solani]QRW19105.1 Sugar (and other) transporter [Rhizoctonia solani]